ncbi:FHA domain-containing protein [Methyloglobulus morosus KoM1]|uniref:FHA domain-containing protein n=1 Tax=Methyloglobulus morosus KoM1 TaxID=1116472 RepID=V5BWP1_9GAMM|nr:FHA domain-containing protein [Methyloglobulus morosus]ESS70632.1 FHA domain-containing protein [Methyloglobulus morosus KoM1]
MQEDKTVIIPQGALQQEPETERTVLVRPGLQVVLVDENGQTLKNYFFTSGFTAGRSDDNDIVVQHGDVSRHHLEVKQENWDWWLYDLNSTNGIYIENALVHQKSKLRLPVSVYLGNTHISLQIYMAGQKPEAVKQAVIDPTILIPSSVPTEATTHQKLSKEEIEARLLAKNEVEGSGDYTRMVRKIIHEDRSSRGKKYQKVIWILGVFFLFAVGAVGYQYVALSNARALAIDMFYDIKTLEVNLAQSELTIDKSSEVLDQMINVLAKEKHWAEQDLIRAEQEKIKAERQRVAEEKLNLKSMKDKYQHYVKEATAFRFRFPTNARYEEELITKVARDFGESELELPDGFVEEVRKYIQYWQSSSRMPEAMARLEMNNYAPDIIAALETEDLPLQFMYLPLQESNYNTMAIGPETRYGVAKGAWQFLASTGKEYGLAAGPLADVREYDVQDARFDFRKATKAGAKYLKTIFSTEAQASGLLVMAGYNYGHNRVKGMIRKMPDNPRDKNFWKFIQQYQIPKETYDYVFYIFAAAVIGEDPKHFGFNFKSPTAQVKQQESAS